MAIEQRSRQLFTPTARIVKLNPMWGKGGPLYLWAERGMVHWEYAETNGYGTMSWQDAARRVQALSEMTLKSSEDRRWGKERVEMQRFIVRMESVIRQAKEQGSPDDPDAVKEAKRRRKRTSIAPRAMDNIIGRDLVPGRDYRPGPPPKPEAPKDLQRFLDEPN